MKSLGFILAIGLAAGACGDDNPSTHDAAPGQDTMVGMDTMMPDGGPPAGTFTAFVIDLVKNHTTSTELPVAYTTFATLPDPDGDSNNTAAYASLFM